MGRQAYIHRLAFGRSAFDSPLRNEDESFVLGSSVREPNDTNYEQKWNERGHPENLISEAAAKRFRKAQNEVLAACNIVVAKDKNERKNDDAKQLSMRAKIEKVDDDNSWGLLLKALDRALGFVAAWPVSCFQRQYLVYGSANAVYRTTFVNIGSTLLHGLPNFAVANIVRLLRESMLDDHPIRNYANYLELPDENESLSWLDRLIVCSCLLLEVPIDIAATLQSLGYHILPALRQHIGRTSNRRETMISVLDGIRNSALLILLPLYLVRYAFHQQIGRRTFGLLRQVFMHSGTPCLLSIRRSAHRGSTIEATSVPGIGRSLGENTNRRYYGPRSFWPAFKIAFPILPSWRDRTAVRERLKKEVVHSILQMRSGVIDDGLNDHREQMRSWCQRMVELLENDGIDLEEDFYVDLDDWCRGIEERVDEMPHVQEAQSNEVDDTMANPSRVGLQTRADMITTTPQPGIIRARSLTEIQDDMHEGYTTNPEQVERETLPVVQDLVWYEDSPGDQFHEIEAARNRRNRLQEKQQSRDGREFRVTRLSTMAVDSLAWHVSSIITSVAMLPIEAIYCHAVAFWFTSAIPLSFAGRPSSIPSLTDLFGGHMFKWSFVRIMLCSVGIECWSRGYIWRSISGTAIKWGTGPGGTGWGLF